MHVNWDANHVTRAPRNIKWVVLLKYKYCIKCGNDILAIHEMRVLLLPFFEFSWLSDVLYLYLFQLMISLFIGHASYSLLYPGGDNDEK